MAKKLDKPLTPADCDLRTFPYMPLYIDRLLNSRAWIACTREPDVGFYLMNLWASAWQQVPGASLPDDDALLMFHARCFSIERWRQVRETVLRGWVLCTDGRLYHPVVAEVARIAWASKEAARARSAAARAALAQRRKEARDRTSGNAPSQGVSSNDSATTDAAAAAATASASPLPQFPTVNRKPGTSSKGGELPLHQDSLLQPDAPAARRAPKGVGSRLPDAWPLTPEREAMATAARDRVKLPAIDLAVEHARFVSYWSAASGQRAVMRDWDKAWVNWCLKANAPAQRRAAPPAGTRWSKNMAAG